MSYCGQSLEVWKPETDCALVVELNLRSPGYMTGSKQFNKLQRACKTVFSKPVVFLFADLESPQSNSMQSPVEALSQFTPRSVRSELSVLENVRIPEFVAPRGAVPHGGGKSEEANYHREVWRDWAIEVYEYLALLMMPDGKPADRLRSSDSVDPYLSTYVVGDQEDENSKTGDIVRISFSGVLSKGWISQVWKELEEKIAALEEDVIRIAWCSMTVHGFENVPVGWNETERGGLGRSGDGYTLVNMPQHGGILLYELVGGQEDHS